MLAMTAICIPLNP